MLGWSSVLDESEEREQRRQTRHAQLLLGVAGREGTGVLLLRVLVVLDAEVRDLLLAHHPAQRVLELRVLNEQIMLGVEALGKLRALKVEGEPFLDARQSRAAGEIEEQREVEHD